MPDQEPKNAKQKLQESTRGIFKEWNDKATIHKGDSTLIIIKKIIIRIIGIILMTIFSPFIVLALIVAFVVAL